MQVYVAAIRNRNLILPEDAAELYEINMDKEAALEVEFLPHREVFRSAFSISPTNLIRLKIGRLILSK